MKLQLRADLRAEYYVVGEVVYMGPVTLNKDHLVNKAGIEVDVIPIKRSPCTSPLPKRKLENKGRAKSALGFYNEKKQIEERGSLPDLQNTGKIKSIQKGSIMSAILKSNPNILKDTVSSSSTNSVYFNAVDSNNSFKRRLSTDSLTKGNVVSAVKEWMARSTPFGSTDNIRSTDAISLADTTNSLFDDDDNDSVDLQSESVYHLESESSKSDQIPDIFINDDINYTYVNNNDLGTSLTRRIMSSLDQYGLGEQQSGSTSTTFSGVAAANVLRDEASADDKPDESESAQAAAQQQRFAADQHQLSSEMKKLLEEMEKQSKQ